MSTKFKIWSGIAALAVLSVGVFQASAYSGGSPTTIVEHADVVNVGASAEEVLGGRIHNIQESFDAGIAVNGTQVINSSGAYVGALSGTTGAFSSTLAVTGAATFSSTLGVPAGLTTLSSLTVTSTSALQGAVTLSSTLGVPAALTTLSSLSVTGTSILTGNVTSYGTLTGNALSATSTLTIGSGTAIDKHVSASFSVDVDSIGNGAGTSTSVTATGAVAGDSVFVTRTGDWSGASSTANIFGVAGTDTVTVYFQNNSSTAVDLTNSTYKVDVWSH